MATFEGVLDKPVTIKIKQRSISDLIRCRVRRYFTHLDTQEVYDLHDEIMRDVEYSLYKETMKCVNGNQSKAAVSLGISRGTLRKKLKIYDLE